jgi:hypothetical protein
MNTRLNQSGQRAIQYWFVDGLAYLSGGVICLLLACLNYFFSKVPWTILTNLIFFLVIFGGAYGLRRIMLRVKERSTYPRTGYVAPKTLREDKVGLAIAITFTILLLALMLINLIVNGAQSMKWMPAIGGLILGFIFGWAGYQTGLWRLYFLAAFDLLAGFGLSIIGISDFTGAALLMLLTSLVLFTFGGLTRWNYLHHTLTLPGEANGG